MRTMMTGLLIAVMWTGVGGTLVSGGMHGNVFGMMFWTLLTRRTS